MLDIIENKKYTTIFCDIFDTIVHRKVQPEFTKKIWANRLVKLLELDISMTEIYDKRSEIEKKLGQDSYNNNYDWEFQYADLLTKMYEYLSKILTSPMSEKDFKKIATELEIDIESSVLTIDKEMTDKLKKAKNKGKKLYCVSDMYLSQSMLKTILSNIGIGDLFEDIFVSCEYKINKKTGKLYEEVLRKLKVKKEECIMIGDNQSSDYEVPTNLGIKSIHLDCTEYYQEYDRYLQEHTEDIISKKIMDLANTSRDNFEHSIFSLYNFIEKLYYKLLSNNFNEVIFLSREGEYLKKLFDDYNSKIYGKKIKSHYILVSRKATYLPSLRKLEEEDFSLLLKQYLNSSVSEFLGSLNFTREDREKILNSFQEDCKALKKKKLSKHDTEALDEILNGNFCYKVIYLYGSELLKVLKNNKDFKQIYEKNRVEQKNRFKKYIKQITDKKEICVVDVGWNGSIQDNIQNILGNEYKVYGYLYGLVSRNPKKCKNKEGLIFTNVPDVSKNFTLYGENRTIFEIILGASHGSANKYIEENGKVVVTTFEKEEEKRIYENVVSKIQDSMFELFKELENILENGYYDNKKMAKKINRIHYNMVFNPTSEQLKFFNKIYHYENFGVFEFSKFNLKRKLSVGYYLKENLKYFIKRKTFFDNDFWPTQKLYIEKLFLPKFLYQTRKKLSFIKKGLI